MGAEEDDSASAENTPPAPLSPTKSVDGKRRKQSSKHGRIDSATMAEWGLFDQKLGQFVHSMAFETAMGMIILANCVCIGVQVDKCPPADSIRFMGNDPENSAECPHNALTLLEHVFTVIFVAEFFARTRVFTWRYYLSPANLMDAMLVWVTGVLFQWVMPLLNISAGGSAARSLTIFRAFRLMRLARVVRTLPQFKEMWLLLRGLLDSGRTLLWTAVVFLFVDFVFGVVFMMVIADSPHYSGQQDKYLDCVAAGGPACETSAEKAAAKMVQKYFPSLEMTMFTLFQVMTGDSWAEAIARPTDVNQPGTFYLFVCYVLVASFVLLNLVTAVIVDNALAVSKEDEENQLKEKRDRDKANFAKLNGLFQQLDADGSGELSMEELDDSFQDPEIKDKFALLDLSEEQAKELFNLLDVGGDGALSTDEFINGMTKVKQEPKSWDLLKCTTTLERLHMHFERHSEKVLTALHTVGEQQRPGSAGSGPTPPPAAPPPTAVPPPPAPGGALPAPLGKPAANPSVDEEALAGVQTRVADLEGHVGVVAAEVHNLSAILEGVRAQVQVIHEDQGRERTELLYLLKTCLASMGERSTAEHDRILEAPGPPGYVRQVSPPAPMWRPSSTGSMEVSPGNRSQGRRIRMPISGPPAPEGGAAVWVLE